MDADAPLIVPEQNIDLFGLCAGVDRHGYPISHSGEFYSDRPEIIWVYVKSSIIAPGDVISFHIFVDQHCTTTSYFEATRSYEKEYVYTQLTSVQNLLSAQQRKSVHRCFIGLARNGVPTLKVTFSIHDNVGLYGNNKVTYPPVTTWEV
jgi:hypothetical protein